MVQYIHEAVGGDLFHIEQVREYSADHMKLIEEAKAEIAADERPELKNYPDSIDRYDTIFLAYPNWWNTLPMPVVTFLSGYDFSAKRIIPFNTSGGGGFGKSISMIRKYAPRAQVTEGMTVLGADVERNRQEILKWAKKQVLYS